VEKAQEDMKRYRSFAFSDNHRRTLRLVISQLDIAQKGVADECGISQGWLSQLLSGRRLGAEADMIIKIRDGLLRLLEKYQGADKEDLARNIQEMFSTPAVAEEATKESAEALRVAADVVEILFNRCSTKSMRRQVIEFLKTAIEQ
jgi:transcriptional regulator with XRE-family HTH domain